MSNKIKIRRYQDNDAQFLIQIFYNTIHIVNAKDYTKEQLNAWCPTTCLEIEGWKKKWSTLVPFVAQIGETIVGFAEFAPSGHIDCFYVHHEFQGIGVGTLLMGEIEKEARYKSIPRIYADVSITAKPFFRAKGFNLVRQQTIMRCGVELTNFVMEMHI